MHSHRVLISIRQRQMLSLSLFGLWSGLLLQDRVVLHCPRYPETKSLSLVDGDDVDDEEEGEALFVNAKP